MFGRKGQRQDRIDAFGQWLDAIDCGSARGPLINMGTTGEVEKLLERVAVLRGDAYASTWGCWVRDLVYLLAALQYGILAPANLVKVGHLRPRRALVTVPYWIDLSLVRGKCRTNSLVFNCPA